MAELQKGKVANVNGSFVRVALPGGTVTPEIESQLVLAVGDTVAYALFDDGTGLILAKL